MISTYDHSFSGTERRDLQTISEVVAVAALPHHVIKIWALGSLPVLWTSWLLELLIPTYLPSPSIPPPHTHLPCGPWCFS